MFSCGYLGRSVVTQHECEIEARRAARSQLLDDAPTEIWVFGVKLTETPYALKCPDLSRWSATLHNFSYRRLGLALGWSAVLLRGRIVSGHKEVSCDPFTLYQAALRSAPRGNLQPSADRF